MLKGRGYASALMVLGSKVQVLALPAPGKCLLKRAHKKPRRALGRAHVPPTKVFQRLTASVNETIVKPRVAAVVGRKIIVKPRVAAATSAQYL